MTNEDTVRALCKNILSRLENSQAICFVKEGWKVAPGEVFNLVGPKVLTEEDLKNKTLEQLGFAKEQIEEVSVTEGEQFKAAKRMVRRSFGEDELNGLYYQMPMKTIADQICQYLMSSQQIDDVFESDDTLSKMIVDVMRKFNPRNLH